MSPKVRYPVKGSEQAPLSPPCVSVRVSQDEWRTRWLTARWLTARGGFGANGEAGKMWGNETIRLSPDGTLEVDLPKALSHLTNVTARGTTRYRFSCPVSFSYRQEEWLARVEANRAVAYDFCTDERGRVYLDATFTPAEPRSVPTLEELREDPGLLVLAVDHNAGFSTPKSWTARGTQSDGWKISPS